MTGAASGAGRGRGVLGPIGGGGAPVVPGLGGRYGFSASFTGVLDVGGEATKGYRSPTGRLHPATCRTRSHLGRPDPEFACPVATAEAEAASRAPGYRVDTYLHLLPESFRTAVVTLTGRMTTDTTSTLRTVATMTSGDVAAMSVLNFWADIAQWAHQADAIVDPGHRGHHLGFSVVRGIGVWQLALDRRSG